ncbi:MAG: resB [Glaciihabitans sp.]|nr:resB [Glaciihabitans sp.]
MASSRPSDHIESPTPDPSIVQPTLGVVGYARFFWRQLTSMRTALFLLLLLAFAAVPGSLVPQQTSDPNGVIQYRAANPELSKFLDAFGVFNTYTSIWFSAIYLLLFISLVGCIIPRTRHHIDALRTKPPKTPARLERLVGFARTEDADLDEASIAAATDAARTLLRRAGYRTRHFTAADGGFSVSAERGYLRETGNLVFHAALVGILIAVGVGGGFGYTGQKLVVQGQSLTNLLTTYDSFNPGRFFSQDQLQPYRLLLDKFSATYSQALNSYGQAIDYTAFVTTQQPGQQPKKQTIKVNEPLHIGDTDVFLLGNGYAPWVTVRDASGKVAFSQPVAFLPQDANLTSTGVIKVPDGLKQQVGMLALFYPTPCSPSICGAALTSVYPGPLDPTLTLSVYTGNLGLDNGQSTSAFSLNPDHLTKIAGRDSPNAGIDLKLGQTRALPNGLGSVSFDKLPRYATFDVHHDPTAYWALLFAILVLAGLLTGLFIPRRRVWVKAVTTKQGTRFEYAGLARGEDPGLATAVAEIARKHSQQAGLTMAS